MWRKILGYLLVIGSAAIVAIAIALALEPDAELWQSIGPLFLAILFFVQGRSYLSKRKPALATGETELQLKQKRMANNTRQIEGRDSAVSFKF
jgi:membrane protein implicated in regulation of membrane protease activity